ncbi:MAG: preprotein translocase subunit YajC [Caldimonas sp.]
MAIDTDPEGKPLQRIELVTQEPMVNWLSPVQLLQTGLRAAVAATFGSFADARQLQAVLNPAATNPPIDALASRDTLWLDYVADSGDGWHSTYSVAWCVGRESLAVAGVKEPLPRADLLVLGGDQVYPTPAKSGYRTRFLDPYRSAFPAEVPPANLPGDPRLVATPGNHDWYDGLKGFLQLFCSGDYIGRWKTIQHTSYFVVKLPHGWWLWGLDLQLESEIDAQQLAYFERVAAPMLKAGDRVVLSTPEPSWIDESERVRRLSRRSLAELETQSERFKSLKKVEELLADSPARLAAVLTGDLHHYARYDPSEDSCDGTPQRITCGGGGAYLLGTHDLPQTLRFTSGHGAQRYSLCKTFPDSETSESLRNKGWQLPRRNAEFCTLLAAIYLLYAWVLQSAARVAGGGLKDLTLTSYLARQEVTLDHLLGVLPAALVNALAYSPSSVLFSLAIVAGAGAFSANSAEEKKRLAWFGGALHGLLHLGLAVAMLWGFARFNLAFVAPVLDRIPAPFLADVLVVLIFIAEAGVVGGLLGGVLFGTWMTLTNRWFGWHGNDVFSSQGIADHKCFLRMRIDATGLTIHPLKIVTVCREWAVGAGIDVEVRDGQTWKLRAHRGSGARFTPEQEIAVELIEEPIHLPGGAAPALPPAA